MSLKETPRIRQVLFMLDKNRIYKFDVNTSITVKGLKRMINAAANLGKAGLKMIHKETDWANEDEVTLSEINKEQPVVEFQISISSTSSSDLDHSRIKLRIGDYCLLHPAKFTYFYCYNCSSSICSICFRSEKHMNHNVIEKCDYLQDSKHLVEMLFKDVGNFINETKFSRKEDAEELKRRISSVYFPELHDLLKSIEKRQLDLINHFIMNSEISFNNVKQNVLSLKENFSLGLEKLKEEINIENVIVDEEVFLIFDKKYKEMSNDKNRIKEDQTKFEVLQEKFGLLDESLSKIHNELFEILDVEKNRPTYDNIKTVIDFNTVEQVRKEDIIEKVLSDIKPRLSGSRSISAAEVAKRQSRSPVPRGVNLSNHLASNNQYNTINSIFNYNKTPGGTQIEDTTSETTSLAFDLNTKNQQGKEIYKESHTIQKEGSASKEAFTVIETKSISKELTTKPLDLSKIIMRCATGTNEIVVYDESTGFLGRKKLSFPKYDNHSEFLPNCAWINCQGKLYVSGGQIGVDHSSISFFCYDYASDLLVRLPDMNSGRHCHSLIFSNNIIYAVGGHNNNNVEKYDIINMKWLKLSNLNVDRQNSILYVHAGYLYAFFGYTVGAYVDSVERLRLNNVKAKWEFVPYKNNEKINLKIIGCSTVPITEDKIYFFGGKGAAEARKIAFQYDFTNNSFSNTNISLDEPSFFLESTLFKLGEETYGQFDTESGDHILKLLLG